MAEQAATHDIAEKIAHQPPNKQIFHGLRP